jgi:hypothetical protein
VLAVSLPDRAGASANETAFAPQVQSAGSVSTPTVAWRAEGHIVAIEGGLVYASRRPESYFGYGRLRAYEVDRCAGLCTPLWTKPGTFLAAHDGIVYVESNDLLRAYRTSCESASRSCRPLFTIRKEDPAAYEGELYFVDASGTDGLVFVSAAEAPGGEGYSEGFGRMYAYPTSCSALCAPLWRTPKLTGLVRAEPAGNLVYVSSIEGLSVFDVSCQAAGRTCTPLWRGPVTADSSRDILAPVRTDGLVLLTAQHYGGGGDGIGPIGVYVFRDHCHAETCRPVRLLSGTSMFLSEPAPVGHRAFVATGVGGDWMFGFSTRCGWSRAPCRRVWRARSTELLPEPLFTRESVFAVNRNKLLAFPSRCPGPPRRQCRADWAFELPDYGSAPVRGPDDTILLTAERTLFAFPQDCDEPCRPSWQWRADGDLGAVHVAGDTILVSKWNRFLALRAAE